MTDKLSIIIPIYNEEEGLRSLLDRLLSVLNSIDDFEREIVFVNDGSNDNSLGILIEESRSIPEIIILNLSRNFGHQAAISAALNEATGACVVIMDGDLQDPPEVIPVMLAAWKEGNQIVIAERKTRAEKGVRGLAFKVFYWVFGKLSDYSINVKAGVFGLLDRSVVDQLVMFEERNRFIPGLRSWVGFKNATVFYGREKRAAGKPKQTFGRLFRYGFDALFSFSYKPLRISWALGLLISALCFLYGALLVFRRVLGIDVVPGFTTPTVALLFLGGVQLITIGILGEYLGRIYDEVKRRPLYIISERYKQGKKLD